MANLWTHTEQQDIKPISPNFPQEQFNQIAEEVQVEDLQKLLGFNFYQDLIQNPDSDENAALLDGGTYETGGITYFYKGLKYVLAYFLYARYIRVSKIKDTYGGFVEKKFEESQGLNNGDESNHYVSFRKIAFKYWEECVCFIKVNSTDYPYYCPEPSGTCCWPSSSYNRSFCI